MSRTAERRSAFRRGSKWCVGLALLLLGLSCESFPGPGVGSRFLPFDSRPTVQEGEVTVRDGDEVSVGYPKAFAEAPKLTFVEFRQSVFQDRPFSRKDFQFSQQTATGFRIANNHPEANRGSWATIKWRAEGLLAATQPPPPPGLGALARRGKLTQDELAEAIKRAGGSTIFDAGSATVPRAIIAVDLHHTKVTDDDLDSLRTLTRLRSLNLSGTAITDAGLKSLAGLTGLQTLYLNETRVGDTSLQYLQGLAQLRELGVYHTQVTDDGLSSLKKLENLRDLNLSGPRITDRGLTQLAGLRNLKHLILSQTGVSKAGVQELKKALPKIEIIQ